jgi:ABC-type lipoprotein export system ATPase subunit
MFRLKSMRIDKFRNVEPGTTLEFNEGINLVLGKNATGKTTLLELIVAAATWNFSRFENEELDLTIGSSFQRIKVTHSVRHTRTTLKRRDTQPVDIFEHGGRLEVSSSPLWSVEANAKGGQCEIKHSETDSNGERSSRNTTASYFGTEWTSVAMGEIMDKGYEQTVHEISRLLLGVFAFQRALCRLDESLSVVNVQRQSTIEFRRHSGPFFTLNAGTARELLDHRHAELRAEAGILSASDSELNFLKSARRMMNVDEVKTTFRFRGKDELPGQTLLRYSEQDFSIRRGGSSYSFEQFSYGQQRLIAILQYLATNMQIVVADEITNGLHHAWIEEIVGMLNGRQCFLTTQNPLLLDYLTFESAPEVRQRMIRCEQQADQKLVWRNLTNEEAEDFFASSQVGIQHISEIMKTHGLW